MMQYNDLIKNIYPGKLITFEGPDGSGKTSQVELLERDLNARGVNVVFTKEPTNDDLGWEIYDILNNRHKTLRLSEMSGIDFQKLYFQNRRTQYKKVILPCLRGGVHVVSDRGLVSVVFGITDQVQIKSFLALESAMFEAKGVKFISPDLNLIYEVDPEVAFERLKEKKRDLDAFETREKISDVMQKYRWAAEDIPNCVLVDANRSAEEVYIETRKLVFDVLGIKS